MRPMVDEIARRFVCRCLEIKWNPQAEESARQLVKEDLLDWRSVRRLLDAEELAPLLYHLTRERSIIPPDLDRELAAAYYSTGALNTLRLRDLRQVLDLLAARGVSVMLLKGAALIEALHDNAAARPMEDLDLLVRPDSLPLAVDVLSAFSGPPASSELRGQVFSDRERQMSFHKTGNPATVFDLHWQAFDSPFYLHELFTEWLWESSLSSQIDRVGVRILSQEALVLHQCGHYRIDAGRKKLLWLYDIASAISRYRSTLNWDLLIARARMYGLLVSVQRVFSNIDEEWKGLIPPAALDHLARSIPTRAEKAFDEWAVSQDHAAVRLFGVNLESLTGWRKRLRFIGSSIFPPLSYMRHRYSIRNPLLALFSYPYRWLLSIHRLVLR